MREYEEAHPVNTNPLHGTLEPGLRAAIRQGHADRRVLPSGNRRAIATYPPVEMDYTDVHNMEEGIGDWMAAAHPVTQSDAARSSTRTRRR